MSDKMKKLFVFCLIIFIISVVATYVFASQKKKPNGQLTTSTAPEYVMMQPEVLAATDTDFSDNSTFTVLVLGYGGAGHSGGFLTDAIQVIHFDFEQKKIAFISIPRDLWVQLPNGISGKVNQAFALGDSSDPIHSGAQISKQMATQITGLKIDRFISVDFVGFKRAIGYTLDSLIVNVPETLDDKWYPTAGKEQETCGKSPEEVAELSATLSGFELEKQFECRYEHIYLPTGKNEMDGGTALAYVRSRHGSAGGDFSRSQRQYALLLAIRDKLFSLETLKKIPQYYKDFIAHTDTDLVITDIEQLSPALELTATHETVQVTLDTSSVLSTSKSSSGQYILVPKAGVNDFSQIHEFIAEKIQN